MMQVTITTTGPKRIGPIGERKTSKVWHLYSHYSSGDYEEQKYILSSCGFKRGNPNTFLCGPQFITDLCIFDKNKFWLSGPNETFTLRFHSLYPFGTERCYVDHYYYSRKIGEEIRIEWLGQYQNLLPKDNYKIYKIGDEKKIIKKSLWSLIFG